jgi:opacity protein-like surface antigen
MRKIFLLVAVAAALVIPAAAIAATWDNTKNGDLVAQGAACPTGGSGASTGGAWYHFVLNQVSPDFLGGVTVTATFAGSGASPATGPTAVNKKVQHFDIFGVGQVLSASTNINTGPDSKLVISGVICGKKGTPARGD